MAYMILHVITRGPSVHRDFDIYTPCTSYPMNPMTPRWYIRFKEHPSSEVIISMVSPRQVCTVFSWFLKETIKNIHF